ncbi:MAG TPA: glycoside hydrolase N-terminal domain-containing protein, partial [Verrucomicrobiae bacterium]|nr:glycoside hydrolase N-terminal domain-containing protein [Verrucomicrobiae bacterium]
MPNTSAVLAGFLVALWCLPPLASASADDLSPQLHDRGLRFTNAVEVWDEALPLGNGILGALVWGDGKPLRISLDRTDLWDLTPVPEYQSADYNYATMRQWHEQGRHADLVRLYEAPYNRPAPTKIPAGRIELTLPAASGFLDTTLTVEDAMAAMGFNNGLGARIFVHAELPVGLIQLSPAPSSGGVVPHLIPPPFGGRVANAAAGGIGAGDLTQLGYPAPVQTSGAQWQAFTQQGAHGFHFAVYLAWRERDGAWLGAWSVASSSEKGDPLSLARQRVEAALDEG